MASAVGSVYAILGLDSAQFTKGLDAATKAAATSTGRINTLLASLGMGFRATTKTVGGLVDSLLSFKTLIVGGVIGGMALFVKHQFEVADALVKTADRVGITTDALQGLSYAAKLAGVDDLTGSLDKFNANLGLARQGTGTLVDFLKDYDRQALASVQRTTDTGQAFLVLADAVAKESDASKQAALVKAAFGRSDANLINLLKQGSRALDEQSAKARQLGLVISHDLLINAEKTNDQLSTLGFILETKLTSAVIKLAPEIGGLAQRFIDGLPTIISWVEWLGKLFGIIDSAPGNPKLRAIDTEIKAIQNTINMGKVRGADTSQLEQRLVSLQKEYRGVAVEADAMSQKVAKAKAEQAKVDGSKTKPGGNKPFIKSEVEAGNAKAETAADKAAEAEKHLQERIAEANADADAFIATNDKAIQQMDRLRDAGTAAGDAVAGAFEDATVNGAKLGTTLKSLALDLAKIAYQALIGAQVKEGIGSLFGGLFGSLMGAGSTAPGTFLNGGAGMAAYGGTRSITWAGARAAGGPVQAGKTYLVGEDGPEPFTPSTNGVITPNGAMGGQPISLHFNIDARGADAGVQQRIERSIQAAVPVIVRQVAETNRRNPRYLS